MRLRFICSIGASLASIGIAFAGELQLPVMKDGLWQSHMQQTIQNKTSDTTMKSCRSNALNKSMKSDGESLRQRNKCKEVVTQQSPGNYSSEMHCDSGSLGGSVTKTTMIYKGDTSFHMEQRMTGTAGSVTILDESYLGGCPPDMKPGDVVMANGKKIGF